MNYLVYPSEKQKREETNKNSLHKSLKFILIIAQCIGQIPVQGITGNDVKSLHFTWKSVRTFYSIFSCCGTFIIVCLHMNRMITNGTDLFIISDIVLNVLMITVSIFLIKLARNWPKLMREWSTVEILMKSYGWPKYLNLRLKIMVTIAISTTLIQYILYQSSKLLMSIRCSKNEDFLKYYYTVECFPYVFSIIRYSAWIGLIFQFIELLTTFTWTFIDVFIMVMSTALALRFKQVTQKLKTVEDSKTTSEVIWRGLREDYNRLCKLCKILDDEISYIVLASFAGNLFYILIQLFKSLRIMKNNLERVYFFFSFAFLILRTVFVSLYGAWINDESKKPITILNSVPSTIYNLEIRRFIQQISFDTVSITGRNFFSVTRGLILSIAGAIVTYELVLIQFNENLLKEDKVLNVTSLKC